MYRVVKIRAGEELKCGPLFAESKKERATTFLSQYCLSPESSYFGRPEVFTREYDNMDHYDFPVAREYVRDDEEGEEILVYRAQEDLWQVVWDAPTEENEFGRVSP